MSEIRQELNTIRKIKIKQEIDSILKSNTKVRLIYYLSSLVSIFFIYPIYMYTKKKYIKILKENIFLHTTFE